MTVMNEFRDPTEAACVSLPIERHRVGVSRRPQRYVRGEGKPSSVAENIEAAFATRDTTDNQV